MQSEYWSIVYYSLLITISSFLITSIWQDRTSALKRGDEVTVEPDDKSFNDNVETVEGSYFAVVQEDSEEVGSAVMYSVRTVDGESMTVRRENMRHRKWYRLAFLQVTNDKKHDCWSSQTLLVAVSPSMTFSTRRGLRRLSSLPCMMMLRQRARKPQSWHKTRSQQQQLRAVLLTEHQFRGKLPQPFLLPSVRPGLLLRIRNAGGALRFQRRSLREGRRW